jgi:hypothetical protein
MVAARVRSPDGDREHTRSDRTEARAPSRRRQARAPAWSVKAAGKPPNSGGPCTPEPPAPVRRSGGARTCLSSTCEAWASAGHVAAWRRSSAATERLLPSISSSCLRWRWGAGGDVSRLIEGSKWVLLSESFDRHSSRSRTWYRSILGRGRPRAPEEVGAEVWGVERGRGTDGELARDVALARIALVVFNRGGSTLRWSLLAVSRLGEDHPR